MTTLTSNITHWLRSAPALPDIRAAHWILRALMAAIIIREGVAKAPITAEGAEAFGVPLILWGMAAFGEIVAGSLLLIGGAIRTRTGDLMTRAGGLFLAVIVASVIAVVYWAPPVELFLYNQLHLMLLTGGLYFAFRGNAA
ncbi:MAG: hypothetical protein AAF913_12180 [Pseudomonadota bacterium]